MSQLLAWWSEARRGAVNPFEFSVLFHQKFEHIHPFEDGNGRTGRILLNWMLAQYGYWRILIKNSKRTAYFSALDKADDGRSTKLMRFMMKEYRKTIEKYTKR
jgi:Fic family protein